MENNILLVEDSYRFHCVNLIIVSVLNIELYLQIKNNLGKINNFM